MLEKLTALQEAEKLVGTILPRKIHEGWGGELLTSGCCCHNMKLDLGAVGFHALQKLNPQEAVHAARSLVLKKTTHYTSGVCLTSTSEPGNKAFLSAVSLQFSTDTVSMPASKGYLKG